MRVLKVEGSLNLEELIQLKKREKNSHVKQWFQAVILVKEGKSAKQAAKLLHCNEVTICHRVHCYNQDGLLGLKPKYSGRKSRLTQSQKQRLRTRVLEGPKKEDKIKIFHEPAIKKILKDEFGTTHCLRQVYNILHEIGLSPLCPRPKHPKGNIEEQETFKKTVKSAKKKLK